MTRAEFAKIVGMYWKLLPSETLAGASKRRKYADDTFGYTDAIADVATNGFYAEPIAQPMARCWAAYCTICKDGLEGKDHAAATVEMYVKVHNRMHTKGDISAADMQPRPFVGSHKLPYDSDWD